MAKFMIIFGLYFLSINAWSNQKNQIDFNQAISKQENCFYPFNSNLHNLPKSVPGVVCISKFTIDPIKKEIEVLSSTHQAVMKKMKLNSIKLSFRDTLNFDSSVILENNWNSSCDEGEYTVMKITGPLNLQGEVDIEQLEIKVQSQFTVDTCHSKVQEYSIQYFAR